MASWAVQGQLAVTGTGQPLTTARTPAREVLLIKAHTTNADPLFLGEAGVTTSTGYPIQPGAEFRITSSGPLTLNREPWRIYAVGTQGDRLSWIGLRGDRLRLCASTWPAPSRAQLSFALAISLP